MAANLENLKEALAQVVTNVKSIQESKDAPDEKISNLRDAGVTDIYYVIAQNISLHIQQTIDTINSAGEVLDKLTRLEELRSSIACNIDAYRNELTSRVVRNRSSVSCSVVKSSMPQTNYNINNLITGTSALSNIENMLGKI